MNKKSCATLRRALAALLALTMLAALPALGEEVAISLDDDAQIESSEFDSLEIEELPELSGALELDDDIELTLDDSVELSLSDDSLDGETENTSKPIPVYNPTNYTVTMKGNGEFKMVIKDTADIVSSVGNIVSWTNSNDKVVKITRDTKRKNCILASPRGLGVTKIAITLDTGKTITLTLTIEPDPTVMRKLSLKEKKLTLYTGMDVDLKTFLVMEPTYPNWSVNFTTSDKAVLPISSDCIIKAMKPGKATITAVSDNGLKASMDVVVKANCTANLHAKPTAKDVAKLGAKWTLMPYYVTMKGNGAISCHLWLVNGSAGNLTALKNLDLAISQQDSTGNTLIARATLKKVEISCKKNKWEHLTITFPTQTVYCSAQDFSKLKAKDLKFRLYDTPIATYGSKNTVCPYLPTDIPAGNTSIDRNPVKYRALLVSESDFYWPENKPKERWERINRNKGDVKLMQKMLKQVKTPDGGKYAITTQNNTGLNQLKQLIRNTFAEADANDISLFFIATHGDSTDSTPEKNTGSLCMASLGERRPEWMNLSELRDLLLEVPGKVIVILESCGSGAAVVKSNGSGAQSLARAAEAFDAQVVDVFRSADPGIMEPDLAANTGDLRKVNKFYVLTASAYREESFGFDSSNVFTDWLIEGVGKSGSMPADTRFAGNNNGMVDLHELYSYISNVGDYTKIRSMDKFYYQHVQVYPNNLRYTLFK